MSILRTEDLSKSYATDGTQAHVLSHINMEIEDGEFIVIMGRSGSGKSTLLYCLSGMDSITSGDVYYGDASIKGMKDVDLAKLRRKEIGFVFQQMQLIDNLSLFENIVVPGYLCEKDAKKVHQHADTLLNRFEINHIRKHLPSQCSGGEQQRCGIARALINKPKVLFADEPTGALNSKMGVSILDALSETNKHGQSIVMVTHDIKAAVRANRILYLQDGSIIGEMKLPVYDIQDSKSRETQVIAWLNSMGW